MDKLKMHSPNLTQDNIARIQALFPNCVTEARVEDGSVKLAVDFDQLRQELSGSIVEGPQERYHLNWPGKGEALLNANAPIAKTLRPCRDESVNFDTTKHIFVEGDNLDALKLLQETYLGQVDLIYVDPPYNSGADWIYEDNFVESTIGYLANSSQTDAIGSRLIANTEANGRFHSNWLSMMYPRLKLARNLLSETGVLIAAIDDHEHASLKHLLDQVFGAENFLTNVVWQGRAKNDARFGAGGLDYMLIYGRDRNSLIQADVRWKEPKSGYELVVAAVRNAWEISEHDATKATTLLREWWKTKPDTEKGLQSYMEIDETGRAFLRGPLASPNPRANLQYELLHPRTGKPVPMHENGWRYSRETMEKMLAEGRIVFGTDETTTPRRKMYLDEQEDQSIRSLITQERASATSALIDLMGGDVFDNPKDVGVISKWINAVSQGNKDATVLDFFGGSGSTGHAIYSMNAIDGGNRRFILVQIPADISPETTAAKAGFSKISEVTKERLRRAGTRIAKDAGILSSNMDTGFRVLKIDSSNMTDVYYAPDSLDKINFDMFVDNIKPDRTVEDLLFQVMLDWGVDLALPIAKETIQGKEVFFVDGNALAACFDASGGVDQDFVKALAKHQPMRVVFRDAGFKDSAVKINVEQIFKQLSPSTEVKCL
jgi:adenine-specific DNA-methyltransferase